MTRKLPLHSSDYYKIWGYQSVKRDWKLQFLKSDPEHLGTNELTHWGRVTHICASNLTNIGSDNGLSPGRRQAIIWTNAGILLIGPLGTNFSEMLIEIHTFSFKKIHLKMSSGKWRPFCLGLNVLKEIAPPAAGSIPKFRRSLIKPRSEPQTPANEVFTSTPVSGTPGKGTSTTSKGIPSPLNTACFIIVLRSCIAKAISTKS